MIAVNGDVGETIGWPELTRTVAAVYRRAGSGAVIFTSNYGEAGAIDRYGPALGLPPAYSGHNAFGYWGPPPDRAAPVITVGLGPIAAPPLPRLPSGRAHRQLGRRGQRRARRAGRAVRWSTRSVVNHLA